MTKTPRRALSGPSHLYANKVIEAFHNALVGHEFDANFLYARGDQDKLLLQKRLLLGLVSSVVVFVSLSFLSVAQFIVIVASLLPFIIVYYLRILVLKDRLRKQRVALERVLPLLRLVVKFLLKIAGDEYDIQKVFVHSLQYISPVENGPQFIGLIKRMVLGEPVERILSKFESPSHIVNDFIQACSDVKAFPYLSDDLEAFSQYKVFLKTLESRMVIIVAEAIFLPILASLVYAFQNMEIGMHVVFAAVHLLILKYLARFLLNKDFSLLYLVGLFPDQSRQLLDDFISFLIALGRNLKYHSPEKALMLSFTSMSREFLQLLGINNLANAWITSFHEKMVALSAAAKSGVMGLIFNIISKFEDYAGADLARFIIDIAVELKRQKEIEEEKVNIINAERFKVKILVACLTLILSFLSVLFSLLASGANGVALETFSMLWGRGIPSVSLFVAINLFYNYTSCLYLIKITGILNAHKYAVIVSLLFVAINLLGISFLDATL